MLHATKVWNKNTNVMPHATRKSGIQAKMMLHEPTRGIENERLALFDLWRSLIIVSGEAKTAVVGKERSEECVHNEEAMVAPCPYCGESD